MLQYIVKWLLLVWSLDLVYLVLYVVYSSFSLICLPCCVMYLYLLYHELWLSNLLFCANQISNLLALQLHCYVAKEIYCFCY